MSSSIAIPSPASSSDSVYTVHNLDYFYTDFTAEELAIFVPTPIMSMIDLIDSFPTTPTDMPMASIASIASIGTPTPSPTLSKARLIEPHPETTADELILPLLTSTTPHHGRRTDTIPTHPNLHQYPPSDSLILTIAATLGRVTLGRTNVTIPDYPETPVWTTTQPLKCLIQPGILITGTFRRFRIDREVKSNRKVVLYECQDMDTADTRTILAVPTQWTYSQISLRCTLMCRHLRLLVDRLVYSLTHYICI